MKVLLEQLAKPLKRYINHSSNIEHVYIFEIYNAEKQLVYISPVYFLTSNRAKISGDIVCDWFNVPGMSFVVRKVSVDSQLFSQLKIAGSCDLQSFNDVKSALYD